MSRKSLNKPRQPVYPNLSTNHGGTKGKPEHCTGPDLHSFYYYTPYNSTDLQSFLDTKTVIMTDAKDGRNRPTKSRLILFFKAQPLITSNNCTSCILQGQIWKICERYLGKLMIDH